MINYEKILSKPAFSALEPERKEAFRDLMMKIDGKSSIEAMGIIMSFGKNMPKGKDLNRQEQSAMMTAILESMDEKEKQKYSAIIKMMELSL